MRVKISAAMTILVVAASFASCKKPQTTVTGMPTSPAGEADMLLSQVTAYLDDSLFDNADRALARLEELKPKLEADYGPKIERARQMVTTAKAKAKK